MWICRLAATILAEQAKGRMRVASLECPGPAERFQHPQVSKIGRELWPW